MNILQQLAQSTNGNMTDAADITTLDPAVAAGLFVFVFIAFAITYVAFAIVLAQIFKKAGVASWIAWVPVYNSWKILEIGGQSGFWAVLTIVPFVNYVSSVFIYIAMYNIGLKLEKSSSFIVLGIFLPVVWYIWLAVDSSKWNGAIGAPSKAIEHNGGSVPPVAAV